MIAKVSTLSMLGLETFPVEVEVDTALGLPNFTIVGLGATSVQEAKPRVKSAIKNSQLTFPHHRITVNLAPAHFRKDGSHYDLPIAVGILVSQGILPIQPKQRLFLGELSLHGYTHSTQGVMLAALNAYRSGYAELFIPAEDVGLVASIPDIADGRLKVYLVKNLTQLAQHLLGHKAILPLAYIPPDKIIADPKPYLDNIKGQKQAKRAIMIAAAGNHNIVLSGPPGSGKTMLAQWLAKLLPALSLEESFEVSQIYGAAKLLNQGSLITERPFRAPHHTASQLALLGGGSQLLPGEVSLAHHGILFLDEMLEFSRYTLECLRQPIQDHVITISRAQGSIKYPSHFLLVGAYNPCRCGYYKSSVKACTCSTQQVLNYQHKLSGPLLDRTDLQLAIQPTSPDDILDKQDKSINYSDSVNAARARQATRYQNVSWRHNSDIPTEEIHNYAKLSPDVSEFIKQAAKTYAFSARSINSLIKVALTIADLDRSDMIKLNHIAEACSYRYTEQA